MTRIKELREAFGIKQEELAMLCNVTQSTVSQWEIGRTAPRKKALEKLSERFGVSAGYILGIDDTRTIPDITDIDFALSGEISRICRSSPASSQKGRMLRPTASACC